MNFIKRWLAHTLGFSRAQAAGFLVLLPLMLLVTFSNPIYRAIWPKSAVINRAEFEVLDSLIAVWEKPKDASPPHQLPKRVPFDPNLVTYEQLQKLGFSPVLANRLISYRTKGGKFNTANDLMKLYGMDSALFKQLRPLVAIPASEKITMVVPPQKQQHKIANTKKEIIKFDINEADTTQLKEVHGIGSKLALRMVRYRSALGGFIKPEQLYEVWGLDSAVANKVIRVSFINPQFKPVPIFINKVSEKEWSTHPYLSKKMISALVAYRFQHGKFSSVADLEKVQSLDMKTIQKITPYLSFE